MNKTSVIYKGKTYKYILSLLDVFLRFHWLRPLESKHSIGVKRELKKIYLVRGFPKRLQSDNDGKFKKHVRQFCTADKVKMGRCWNYHPQHRLKNRALTPLIMAKNRKHGINWAKQLTNYGRCLNNEKGWDGNPL